MAAGPKGDGGIHERRSVAKGTVVIKEGDQGDNAYLIQSGQVQVYSGKKGRRVKLATLGPGQIFGEMALLFDEERTATVESLEPCTFVIITREILKEGQQQRSDGAGHPADADETDCSDQ